MKRFYLLIMSLSIICHITCAKNEQDSILQVVSNAIDNKRTYDKEKERILSEIKNELNKSGLKNEQRYDINRKLYKEYKIYKSDSAIYYINQNLQIANSLKDKNRIIESKIDLSSLFSLSDNYLESLNLLNSIDKKELNRLPKSLLIHYYEAYRLFHFRYAQSSPENNNEINQKKSISDRDSLLALVRPDSSFYKILKAENLLDKNKTEDAKEELSFLLDNNKNAKEVYTEANTLMAMIYNREDSLEQQIKYLALSAISNIENSNKINPALYNLGISLLKKTADDKTYKFIKSSIDDAVFYNADFKASNLNRFFDLISTEKNNNIGDTEQTKLILIAGGICLLIILLIIFSIGQRKRFTNMRNKYGNASNELKKEKTELKKLFTKLRDMDVFVEESDFKLKEANLIKISYLNQYIKFGTDYIDKLDSYRRTVDKFVSENPGEYSGKILKPSRFLERELKELHTNFDETFLQIYPTFIESFNALFPEEERQKPKQDELLNAELRICALLRLGITDSAKIADFLRYSITTIYTYRSKLKNKSLYKDNFEEQIMKIAPNIQ